MKLHVVIIWDKDTVSVLPDKDYPEITAHDVLVKRVSQGWVPLHEEELRGFNLPPGGFHVKVSTMPYSGIPYVFMISAPAYQVVFPAPEIGLTPGQYEVLTLLMAGKTTKQICEQLSRSRRWVLYRIAEVKAYFKVTTRNELLRFKDEVPHLRIEETLAPNRRRKAAKSGLG